MLHQPPLHDAPDEVPTADRQLLDTGWVTGAAWVTNEAWRASPGRPAAIDDVADHFERPH